MLPKRGQKSIPLSDWQRFLRVADWFDRTHGYSDPSADRPDILWPVRLSNQDNAAYRRYEVLSLTGEFALDDLTHNAIWLEAEKSTYQPRLFGVLIEPADEYGIAKAQISGVCPAFINIVNDAHRRATLIGAEDRFTSNLTGPVQILYKPAEVTGEQLCVVNLSNRAAVKLYGYTDGDGITAATVNASYVTPGSGTVEVWTYNHANSRYEPLKDSGDTQVEVTVYNPFSGEVAADTWVSMSEDDDGVLIIDAEDCGA